MRPITALFDSECEVCLDDIFEGNEIVKDEYGSWIHAGCADE